MFYDASDFPHHPGLVFLTAVLYTEHVLFHLNNTSWSVEVQDEARSQKGVQLSIQSTDMCTHQKLMITQLQRTLTILLQGKRWFLLLLLPWLNSQVTYSREQERIFRWCDFCKKFSLVQRENNFVLLVFSVKTCSSGCMTPVCSNMGK